MANRIKERILDNTFIEICNSSDTMVKAAEILNLHFNSFCKRAKELNCYRPNQGGKGLTKKWKESRIKTIDILEGKYPQYQTYKLKNRMLDEGYLQNKCSICEIKDWQGKLLNMELDHIDGNRTNHLKENLRLLCPNCHAQTPTYRSKIRI